MRILKGKIARALKTQKMEQLTMAEDKQQYIKAPELIIPKKEETQKPNVQNHKVANSTSPVSPSTNSKGTTSTKNIMKNYSRALVNFALSDLALPYLRPMLESHDVKIDDFKGFLQSQKNKINCIKSLRELLLYEDHAPRKIKHMKTIFKLISIVFMKYFSVNWIFQSKIQDRQTHLKYRFKILRRLNDPIHFTYLEDFTK